MGSDRQLTPGSDWASQGEEGACDTEGGHGKATKKGHGGSQADEG